MNALCSRRPHIRGDPEPRKTRVKIIHVLDSPHSSPERRCAAHSTWCMVYGPWWLVGCEKAPPRTTMQCALRSTVHSPQQAPVGADAQCMVHGPWWMVGCEMALLRSTMRSVARFAANSPQSTDVSRRRWAQALRAKFQVRIDLVERRHERPCNAKRCALRGRRSTVHRRQPALRAKLQEASSKFQSGRECAAMLDHAMRSIAEFLVAAGGQGRFAVEERVGSLQSCVFYQKQSGHSKPSVNNVKKADPHSVRFAEGDDLRTDLAQEIKISNGLRRVLRT